MTATNQLPQHIPAIHQSLLLGNELSDDRSVLHPRSGNTGGYKYFSTNLTAKFPCYQK
jgi:hypothetical protein